ncbi:MAG TPA: LysR family transcriptional regulator substrate-binding protein, partial [Pseudonocardiaceae bacterium]
MPDQPAIRFGIHGSPDLATRILADAGRSVDEVRWFTYDVADPFRELRAGDVDVMIVKFTVREPDLAVSRPISHDERAVVVGASHPLAGRESVSVEDLADYPAFDCPGRFPAYVWDEMVPPRTPAGRRIHRAHRMGAFSDLVDQLATTRAVHLTVLSLRDIAPSRVRVIPIHDLPAAPVALAWLAKPGLPPR